MRLLIVEDDHDLSSALKAAFDRRDIASDHAADGSDAIQMLGATRYAAVLLDLGLPDGEGLDILRHLRRGLDPIPVLVLTARGDVSSRIAGLDAGADDYLIKPFDFDELDARLRAVLRRKGDFQSSLMTFGNLRFDASSRELLIDGRPVALSQRECQLIDLLLRRAGRVVTKQLAEDQLFGLSEDLNSNAVEVYVHRLRRKLEQAGSSALIETVRGIGYLFRVAA